MDSGEMFKKLMGEKLDFSDAGLGFNELGVPKEAIEAAEAIFGKGNAKVEHVADNVMMVAGKNSIGGIRELKANIAIKQHLSMNYEKLKASSKASGTGLSSQVTVRGTEVTAGHVIKIVWEGGTSLYHVGDDMECHCLYDPKEED